MKKKVIAVAVAGVLAAPAAALAQSSTVQIYGLLNVEYGFVNQPNNAAGLGRSNVDALDSGASRIGFKGEEKLGGSLSAFFQCETDVRFLGGNSQTNGNWCDRNSALGLKGNFGSVFIGTWDSPMKRVSGITRLTNETGWSGTQLMTLSNAGSFAGSFSQRNIYTVNYDTPNFNGFSGSIQYTTLQAARNAAGNGQAGPNVVPTPKGRVVSLSGQYIQGPMAIVAAYTTQDDDRSNSGLTGADDDAWLIGGYYVFGNFKVALTYVDAEYATSVTASTKRKSWHLPVEWKLGGPHMIRAAYSQAGDAKTSAGGGADTGAKLWQVSYNYSFSKRTTGSVVYARMDNDRLGTYALTGNSVNGAAGGIQPGDSSGVIVLQMVHTF